MAEKIFMIALSPTMEEGTILKWTKKEGDVIATGDVICEVETDKASMDYESAQEGTLLKIVKGEGSGAKVGDTIGIIGESGEDIAEILKEAENEAAAPSGEGDGDAADTDKSADNAADTKAADKTSASSPAPSPAPAPQGRSDGRIVASPLALKLAAQKGIDISTVHGSGPNGRIVKRDIESYKGPAGATSAPSRPAQSFAPAAAAGEDREIPVTGKRAVIAKRLAESMFSAVHYYVKNKVAMDNLMAARSMLNKEVPEKVSFNAFMIKFVAEALKRYPAVNASWQGDKILEFGSIDIGLAVDLGNGLITPIVRNAGNKGVVQIDSELKELIKKAGDGSLKPEEYTGATFSISNLGSFGVDEFTAVINPPGSAILALGKVTKTPVYDDGGNLVPVNQMVMTLSCDHRVIDGALGGRFLSELQKMMENPVRLLF